jgi:hypothetical protein
VKITPEMASAFEAKLKVAEAAEPERAAAMSALLQAEHNTYREKARCCLVLAGSWLARWPCLAHLCMRQDQLKLHSSAVPVTCLRCRSLCLLLAPFGVRMGYGSFSDDKMPAVLHRRGSGGSTPSSGSGSGSCRNQSGRPAPWWSASIESTWPSCRMPRRSWASGAAWAQRKAGVCFGAHLICNGMHTCAQSNTCSRVVPTATTW